MSNKYEERFIAQIKADIVQCESNMAMSEQSFNAEKERRDTLIQFLKNRFADHATEYSEPIEE